MKPLIAYKPSFLRAKPRVHAGSDHLNLTIPMFAGFSAHVIIGVFELTVRLPGLMNTVASSANLSVWSPLVNAETSGNAFVREEKSIVEPSCIVTP